MISMDHLVGLGQRLVADNGLSSPMVIVEYATGRGLIPLSELAAESIQQAMYDVGWQAARNERQTGRVQEMAAIAGGWIGNSGSGPRPSAGADRQEVVIISTLTLRKQAEHTIYSLKREADGRVELSAFDPQPDRILSPLVDQFIKGYQDGQLALKHQRQKEAQLE